MKKPNDYDEVKVGGDYTPIELGGHTAIIKKLEETTSKSGKPMIKVAIDFDKADSQPEYFMEAFKADTRQDKKWPYQAVQYIMSEDANGNTSKSFKGFITSVETSNNSTAVWGDGFASWFTGKKVGVVFGEQEDEYNGEIKTRRRIRYFCDYAKVKDASIPDKKMLANSQPAAVVNDFVNVAVDSDDGIPF